MAIERDSGLLTAPSSAGEIHRGYMLPGETVVIVGQGHTCLNDQTALLYCSMAYETQGAVLLVDPQGRNFSDDRTVLKRRNSGIIYGEGGALDYRDEIIALAQLGMPLIIPEWLGRDSTTFHIPIAKSSVHKIVDHNTTGFLAICTNADRSMPEPHHKKAADVIRTALREYHRVLMIGGTIMYQANMEVLSEAGILSPEGFIDIADTMGFTTSQYRTVDRVQIPVPPQLSARFSESRTRGIGQMYYHIQDSSSGSYFIKDAIYTSPDFFVCTKSR